MNNQDKAIIKKFFGTSMEADLFSAILAAVQKKNPSYIARYNGSVIGISLGAQRYAMYVKKGRNNYYIKFSGVTGNELFSIDNKNAYIKECMNRIHNQVRWASLSEKEYKVDYDDLVYISSDYENIENAQRINGLFKVIDILGRIKEIKSIIKIDEDDNIYIRDNVYYGMISRFGVPCVRAFLLNDKEKVLDDNEDYFESLAAESQLKSMGYTTSIEFHLSDVQREAILANIIENGIWSKSHCISHIQWCIDKHPDEKYARNRDKWMHDITYLMAYDI